MRHIYDFNQSSNNFRFQDMSMCMSEESDSFIDKVDGWVKVVQVTDESYILTFCKQTRRLGFCFQT